MKQNDFFDLTKYLLSFMVVAIHIVLFPTILFPWLRIAVPLFFIISSYLLFTRIKNAEEAQKGALVKAFIIRNFHYYLFWFVILLPFTIFIRKEWATEGYITLLRKIITNTLFSSTFPASWYITASMWAIIILFITRNVNKNIMIIILSMVYIICCMRSGYYFIFKDNHIISKIIESYEFIFTSPVYSFPVATFWMFIGKLFAEQDKVSLNKTLIKIGLVIFAICLYIEWKTLINLGGDTISDCLLFLPPLCICIFSLINSNNISIPRAKLIRSISTIMYPSHFFIAFIVTHVLTKLNISVPIVKFVLVIFICHIISIIILKLENKKHLVFLKYSH